MTEQVEKTQTEQRKEQRLDELAAVFIEWLAGADGLDGAAQSSVILCSSADLSAHGLRVSTDRPLPVGAILSVGVELKQRAETLFLAAEVRWCKADEKGRYQIGFSILHSEGSDYQRWQALLSELQGLPSGETLNYDPPTTSSDRSVAQPDPHSPT